jgi:hypothetical protein
MRRRMFGIVILASLVSGLGAGGCSPDIFVDVLGTMGKLSGGQLSALTADEIKMLNHGIARLDDGQTATADCPPLVKLTGEQCAAMVQFFRVNQFDTAEAVFDIIGQADQDPTAIQGVEELAKAFEGSDIVLDVDHPGTPLLRQLLSLILSASEYQPPAVAGAP